MILGAIFKFFSEVFQAIIAFITGVIRWCREHPKAAIAILVLVVSNLFVWHFSTVHQRNIDTVKITALQGQIAKCNEETKARGDKIVAIENASKKTAADSEKALANSKKMMEDIVAQYQKKLNIEKKKNKIVVVKDPVNNKDTPVEFNTQGQVVCERLHDTFSDSLNELVREVNAPASTK